SSHQVGRLWRKYCGWSCGVNLLKLGGGIWCVGCGKIDDDLADLGVAIPHGFKSLGQLGELEIVGDELCDQVLVFGQHLKSNWDEVQLVSTASDIEFLKGDIAQ